MTNNNNSHNINANLHNTNANSHNINANLHNNNTDSPTAESNSYNTNLNSYNTADEYLSDLLKLTSLRIRHAKESENLQKAQNYGAAALENGQSDMAASQENSLQLLKKLNKQEQEIGIRLQNSPEKDQFPACRLKQLFHLTAFQFHCILSALLAELPEGTLIFPYRPGEKNFITTGLAAKSFTKKIDFSRMEKELNWNFKCLFFPSAKTPDTSAFETPLYLSSQIRDFLLPEKREITISDYNLHSHESQINSTKQMPDTYIENSPDSSTRNSSSPAEFQLPSFMRCRPVLQNDTFDDTANTIKNICQASPTSTMINVYGATDSGRLYRIRQGISESFSSVLLISLTDFIVREAWLWQNQLFDILRSSILQNSAVCFLEAHELAASNSNKSAVCLGMIFDFASKYLPLFFLITEKPFAPHEFFQGEITTVHLPVSLPDQTQQLILWKKMLAKNIDLNYTGTEISFTKNCLSADNYSHVPQNTEKHHYHENSLSDDIYSSMLQSIVNKYDFYPGQIKKAAERAQILMKKAEGPLSEQILNQACHSSCEKLRSLGTHSVSSDFNWEDLILPEDQKDILKHACNHVHLSHIVYQKWNYHKLLPYGRSLILLFEGPPGTGKTMAAQIIAKDLRLDIYKVDISQTVSKYIGETEENLNKIFDEAERSNVILFIDEMDALFGKRTEIKDSHDKYANTETSFLLQKMESYRGILLLATNKLEDIDEAFIRRISFIVHFSLPDRDNRKKLWMSMFPDRAPVSSDLDFDFLADEFVLSGGVIKNIVLKAAYLAAAEKKRISMKHIFISLQDELTKQGKILLDSDFGKYRYLLHQS